MQHTPQVRVICKTSFEAQACTVPCSTIELHVMADLAHGHAGGPAAGVGRVVAHG